MAASFTSFGVTGSFTSISIPSSGSVVTIPASSSSPSPSSPGSKTTSTPVSAPVQSSPTSTSKPAPAGAIAGGVVGGLAVVGALGFGIFYLLSRRRRGDAPAANVAVGGPPPMDPKSPMSTYVGPVENVAGPAVGGAAVSTMGGPQTEYYSPPGAVGAMSEKTAAASNVYPMPYQSLQPQNQYMSYTPEGMSASGLSPQGQQVPGMSPSMSPPLSPSMSPAPPYVPDPNRMSNVPVHEGSMSPPMNNANMIDGRQVWPTGPGVHEAPGSIPGQPSGNY